MKKKQLVAIGDSIVWGQGNVASKKFAARVCLLRGLDPKPIMEAHSGGCISPNNPLTANYGEVPLASPGIIDQVAAAAKRVGEVANVGLVLLNGGINDVPVAEIMAGNKHLERHIKNAFRLFPTLLEASLDTFPAATVVAVGYYPIVSDESPDEAVLGAMLRFGPPELAADIARALEENAGDSAKIARKFNSKLSGLGRRCELFAACAESEMQRAVAKWKHRAVFAAPAWAPKHCLGVPKTSWLWSGVNDAVFSTRVARFLMHTLSGHTDWPLSTIIASLGHPNVEGSRQYANAIVAALPRPSRVARSAARTAPGPRSSERRRRA